MKRPINIAGSIGKIAILPLVKLRSKRRGYAVSIIKAGHRVVGKPAGSVRPPLVDLDQSEQEELARLIADASGLIKTDTQQ
jgi:5-dehydro-4-deoxyglucarate dehydratase